jgi:hypothetical protein
MAGKTAAIRKAIGSREAIGSRSAKEPAGRIPMKPSPSDVGDALTPAEAKRLRQSLKQTREGKTRPWAEIKNELGL